MYLQQGFCSLNWVHIAEQKAIHKVKYQCLYCEKIDYNLVYVTKYNECGHVIEWETFD